MTIDTPLYVQGLISNGLLGKTENGANTVVSHVNGSLQRKATEDEEANRNPLQIVWKNVIVFIFLHLAALYGALLFLTGQVMWQTFLWGTLVLFMTGFSITAGTHRLWSHKSYKAKLPLRILLCVMQTMAAQNSILEWCRDHRVHHKYAETDADPHNANRGFFFAHIGWLMCRKHTLVKEKGKGIDLSDLEADPVVMFQKRYYMPLAILACFVIPTLVPWYFWDEKLGTAWHFCTMLRYTLSLHGTWLVNSAAHLYGSRPYDVGIGPRENRRVSIFALGEGWHNYHHVFPWDYKTAEVGVYRYNFTAAFVDFFAKIGWAHDLKTVPKDVVMQRVGRTGDGSHGDPFTHPGPWGWGDKDIPMEDKALTLNLHAMKEE